MKYFSPLCLTLASLLLFSCGKDSPVDVIEEKKNDIEYISWSQKGEVGLYAINKDGADQHRKFLLPPNTWIIGYSPDRKHLLAFEKYEINNGTIVGTITTAMYMISPTGVAKKLISVPETKHICEANWAASSEKFVYSIHDVYPARGSEIYIMNKDGSGNQLLQKEPYSSCAILSKEGKVYYSVGNKIYSLNPHTKEKTLLATLDSNASIRNLSFSPDEQKLAFSSMINNYDPLPDDGLFIMNIDGKNMKRLFSNTPVLHTISAWSKDGLRLLLNGWESLPYRVYQANSDGSGLKVFKPENEQLFGSDAVWSPDEKYIAYTGKYNSDVISSVYVMDANGLALKKLATDAINPVWMR